MNIALKLLGVLSGSVAIAAVPLMVRPTPGNSPSTVIGAKQKPICTILPSSHPINTNISKYPVDPRSKKYISSISKNGNNHLRLGFGLPVNVVGKEQKKVPLNVVAYPLESDPGPYPIPMNAKIQDSPDKHMTVFDKDNCMLYELYMARLENGSWLADSAAKFDLRSGKQRPDGWTSADAAGLPMYPVIIKYDEVKRGEIRHAIRVTVDQTQHAYMTPATHAAGIKGSDLPPMGLRLRLKKSFDISKYPRDARVILKAMKEYGLIVADNGTSWTIGGEYTDAWDFKALKTLEKVPGSAFEVVKTSPIRYPKY